MQEGAASPARPSASEATGDGLSFGLYRNAMSNASSGLAPSPCEPRTSSAPDRPPAQFDAVLYPNRSLGTAGFAVLMLGIVVVSACVGAGFFMIGAWPVTGFLGLDVLLIYLAFRWNYREGRRAEFIRLDRDGLTVRRVTPAGRQGEWRFEPYWVQVRMDDPPRHDSQLSLSSHGRELTVGAVLSPGERLEVARELRSALRAYRSPD
jgi:uncharacterized membrane protein